MNTPRSNFGKNVPAERVSPERDMNEGGGEHSSPVIGTSTVKHHEDGSHSVEHHDGDKSTHPSAGHMAMLMASKHDGGEHGHIMPTGAGAKTHYVDDNGEVCGPDEHGTLDEAMNHLRGVIGDGGEPDGDEGSRMGGQSEEDSSFA